jgi:hypothetical protein
VNPQGEGGGEDEGTRAHRLAHLGGEETAGGSLPAWRPKGGDGRHWVGRSGEGKAQRGWGTASRGPEDAIYRRGKGREERTAGRHGGGTVARHWQLGPAVVGAWGCEEVPRGRAKAEEQA